MAAPEAVATPSESELACDVVVVGAGPGGYSAAFRAADLGARVVLVERYTALGGVCLNAGCIPSKAMLHVASVLDEAARFEDLGIRLAAPCIDLPRLRAHKRSAVERLTSGVAALARMRKITVVQGRARFLGPRALRVEASSDEGERGSGRTLRFGRAIIAAGSRATRLSSLPDDPRIVDASDALELPAVPQRMLLVGGGIIGLELGTVYSSLGARLDLVELRDRLMPGADRDLVDVWQSQNVHRFDHVMLDTRVAEVRPTAGGVEVAFEGADAPADPQFYDLVLQAVGRTSNGDRIGAGEAGIAMDEAGFIPVDRQMRTRVPHIFAVGDIVGPPMLAHKAVHQGHVAAEVATGELLGSEVLCRSSFDARVIPSVAYTDPEIAWVGISLEQALGERRSLEQSAFPWKASGRAIASGRSEGLTRLLIDPETRRVVGGGIVGAHAGDLIGEIALAIEMGADEVDLAKTIHPHPTFGETIGLAAEFGLGTCTDLPQPPPRQR